MDYKLLLTQHIKQVDFTQLRRAYVQRPDYEPYSLPNNMQPVGAAMKAQDWATAGAMCAVLREADLLQIDLHLLMSYLYSQVADETRARWHRDFATGLTKSIMASGDGQSFATAFVVVHIREEYDVLRFLGLLPVGQQLVIDDERHYDVIDVVDSQRNDAGQLYFDVEILQSHLDQTAPI